MKAVELTAEVKELHERTNNFQRQLERQEKVHEELRKQFELLNNSIVRIQQQLTDHISHVEKWDARRWVIIGLFIASVISLVMNFVVALARK